MKNYKLKIKNGIYNLKSNPLGRRRNDAPESIEPDTVSNKFLTVMTDQSGAAACCPPEAKWT
jgi:hypothetical protein